jgi:hypothetical protein
MHNDATPWSGSRASQSETYVTCVCAPAWPYSPTMASGIAGSRCTPAQSLKPLCREGLQDEAGIRPGTVHEKCFGSKRSRLRLALTLASDECVRGPCPCDRQHAHCTVHRCHLTHPLSGLFISMFVRQIRLPTRLTLALVTSCADRVSTSSGRSSKLAFLRALPRLCLLTVVLLTGRGCGASVQSMTDPREYSGRLNVRPRSQRGRISVWGSPTDEVTRDESRRGTTYGGAARPRTFPQHRIARR